MITKFKIFEGVIPQDEDDLAELFSQKYIEDYYDKNCKFDAEEASSYVNLWNYCDHNKVRSGLIEELVESSYIDDKEFTTYDYVNFIKTNMLKQVKPELDKFNKEYNFGETYEELLNRYYRKDLIRMIDDEYMDDFFLRDYYEDKYSDEHPEVLLYRIYGKHAVNGSNLYEYLKDYVNEDKVIEDAKDKIQFETKFDFLRNNIFYEKELQYKLLEINPDTIEALFDVIYEENTIGAEYDFQKKYIEYQNKMYSEKGYDSIADSIKKIHDRFGLNPEIEKEYQEHTYLIDAQKYNL